MYCIQEERESIIFESVFTIYTLKSEGNKELFIVFGIVSKFD